MVNDQHQDMFLGAGADQTRTQQRAGGQVERCLGFLAEQGLKSLLARHFGLPAQVNRRELKMWSRRDDLDRLVGNRIDSGSQYLVALDNLAQTPGQSRDVQPTRQPKCEGDVVERAVRLKAIQKP